jgi:hypothetical protein
MAESSDIDAALIERLATDATLRALCPDGVYFDLAPKDSQRFVHVSLAESLDSWAQGEPGKRRAQEDCTYAIQACVVEESAVAAKAAAQRIDELLEDQPLTMTGYRNIAIHRVSRIRLTAADGTDPSLRWQYRGGRYRVAVTPTPSAERTRS